MKFIFSILSAFALVPAFADAWSLGPSHFFQGRPMIMYSPRDLISRQNELMSRAFTRTSPRYEVTDDDTKFHVAIDVPGVKLGDIHVDFEEDIRTLTVTASREATNDQYSFSSKFSQSFSIDPTVEIEKFKADLKDGVLVISAPKDPKKIEQGIRRIPVVQAETKTENVHPDITQEKLPVTENVDATVT